MRTDAACRSPLQHELSAYIYGDLTPQRAAEVAEHLQHCPFCQQAVDELRQVRELLPPSVASVTPQEVLQLQQRVSARLHRSRRWVPAFATTATALLALVIYFSTPALKTNQPASSAELLHEIEVLEHMEMLQSLDLLNDLELLEALEARG